MLIVMPLYSQVEELALLSEMRMKQSEDADMEVEEGQNIQVLL